MLQEIPDRGEYLSLAGDFPGTAPGDLFDHWIDPGRLCLWWPQAAEVEPRPGGAYLLGWPSMGWRLAGRIMELEPAALLRFTWRWEHEPEAPDREVRVAFRALSGGGTRLTLTHGPYADTPAGREAREQVRAGWEHFTAALARVLATG